MQIKKWIATGLTTLMAGVTVAAPALAATTLGDFPTFLGSVSDSTSSLDAYVVVGADANVQDVIGAVDIAVRLAETSYTVVPVAGTAVSGITGLERDGISLCDETYTYCNLSKSAGTNFVAFPLSNLTSLHYSGLKDDAYIWTGDSSSYDYKEQVDISGVYMRHALDVDKINGTEKMVVGTSSPIKYQFVFDKAINISSKDATKGTISSPQYSYPVEIQLLGKDFTIVGAGSTSLKMLSGATGTATATQSVDYGGYKFYAVLGSSNSMQIDVKDENDNPVETLIFTGITSGTATTKSTKSTTPILDVTITAFGTLTDGTVLGCDLVVGPSGTTTHEYDGTADVETTTAAANDAFPGASRWGIRYTPGAGAGDGYIPKGSMIEVVYLPTETEYYNAGEKITLPNDYAELGFEGFNTDEFATVTIKPYGPASAYTVTNKTTIGMSEAYGLEISSNVAGTIKSSTGNFYDVAYLLFAPVDSGNYPVAVGFKDSTTGKILISDNAKGSDDTGEYKYDRNFTSAFQYNFDLIYAGIGEQTYRFNISLVNTSSSNLNPVVQWAVLGKSGSTGTIEVDFKQKSSGTGSSWSTTAAPQFILGSTSGSKDDYEVNVTTEGSLINAAGKTQEIVDDSGLLVQPTSSSTGSNSIMVKVPSKALAVKAYFGKKSGVTTTGETSYNKIASVKSAVAKLDTEITSSDKTSKNLVLMGGPAVNRLTAEAWGLDYPTYGTASTIPENAGVLEVIDDAFATGKVALIIAGWEAADTRLAASVLQQKTDLLGTNTKVKVTGTVASPTITAL